MGQIKNNARLSTVYKNITQTLPLLYKYQWIVEFVGGGGVYIDQNFKQFTLFDNDPNDPASCFAYWVGESQPNIPKFDIAKAKVNFYSQQFNIPACRTYEHNLSFKILLDQDFTIYKKLDTWLKMISRLNIDGGGIKIIPTVKIRLMLLDSENQYFTDSFVFEGCWINKLGGVTEMKYAQAASDKMTADTEFRYQYAYRDPDLDLANDPLNVSKILTAAGTL